MTKHENPVQDIAEGIGAIYDSMPGDEHDVLRSVLVAVADGVSSVSGRDARARAWRRLCLTAERADGENVMIGSAKVIDRSDPSMPAASPESGPQDPVCMITIMSVPKVSIVTQAPVVAQGYAPADPRLADQGIPPDRIDDAYRQACEKLAQEYLAPFAGTYTPKEDTP